MGFYRQFEKFDPFTGIVPAYPFPSLPDIAIRARKLLQNRSREEIEAAACFVDWATEESLKIQIGSEISSLEQKRKAREMELHDLEQQLDEDEYIDPTEFPEIMSNDDLCFSLEDRQIWALKKCYGLFIPTDEPEFKDGKDYEYFAVLALWLVADSIEADNYTGESVIKRSKELIPDKELPPEIEQALLRGIPVTDKMRTAMASIGVELPEYLGTPETIKWTQSCRYAIDAMEAICFAEYLYEVAQIKDKQGEKINEEVKLSASKRARNAANIRHAKTTHKIKKYAIDLYLKERDLYTKSVKDAARTIENDVVEYAKRLDTKTLSGVSAVDQIYTWLREAEKNYRCSQP